MPITIPGKIIVNTALFTNQITPQTEFIF